jgi:hypothetical protein
VPVAALAQVFAAGGHLVQVGELVGRVHVFGARCQEHGEGVMVGGDAAPVAADERHRRAALALPVEVEEVTDDQPEGVQVPVQRCVEPGGAQDHVSQPLDLRGPPGRPLGFVGPHQPGAEVQRQRGTFGQRWQLRDAVHHLHREPAGVTQPDRVAAAVRQDHSAGTAGQPVKVLPRSCLKGGPGETGTRTAADHEARGRRPPAAQQQRLRSAVGDGEAEVGHEPPGAVQVRLLKLQPRQPCHLHQRIPRPPGVLTRQAPRLAVQRTMRVLGLSGEAGTSVRLSCLLTIGSFASPEHLSGIINPVINYQL